jgi:O-antigen/teichoic acid export membrane protein
MAGLNQRLIQGSVAKGVSLFARIVEQLLLVPVFLSTWSVHLYGEWLILSAIPIYFALSDFGFVSAGSNELARRARDGITDEVRQFYVDYVSVFLNWSVVIFLGIALLASTVSFDRMFNLTELDSDLARLTFLTLMASTLCGQNAKSLHAGMRAMRRFPAGIMIMALGSLIRICVVSLALIFFEANPLTVALLMLASQIMTFSILGWFNYRGGLPPSWRLFRTPRETMWPLIKTGSEFMLFPAAHAIIMQGTTLMIGSILSAGVVALYGTHRTLSRFSSQIVQLGVAPLRAEFGLLDVEKDKAASRRLLIRATSLTAWMSFVMVAFLLLTGKFIFEKWTGGSVVFSFPLFAFLLCATVLDGVWNMAASIRTGTNRHQTLARGYFIISLVGLVVTYILIKLIGPTGAAFALCMIEASMLALVLILNKTLLDISPAQFLLALSTPPVKDMKKIASLLMRKALRR